MFQSYKGPQDKDRLLKYVYTNSGVVVKRTRRLKGKWGSLVVGWVGTRSLRGRELGEGVLGQGETGFGTLRPRTPEVKGPRKRRLKPNQSRLFSVGSSVLPPFPLAGHIKKRRKGGVKTAACRRGTSMEHRPTGSACYGRDELRRK